MSDDPTTAWTEATALKSLEDWRVLSGLHHKHDVPAARLVMGAVGVAEIGVQQGRWSRRFMGDRAVIVPFYDPFAAGDDPGDLIAFRPETPRSMWTMTGFCKYLGHDAIDRAQWFHEPVVFYETLLEWLAGDEDGVVVLDWKVHWPMILDGIPAVRCLSVDFARRLKSLLERPYPIPAIEVAA